MSPVAVGSVLGGERALGLSRKISPHVVLLKSLVSGQKTRGSL